MDGRQNIKQKVGRQKSSRQIASRESSGQAGKNSGNKYCQVGRQAKRLAVGRHADSQAGK